MLPPVALLNEEQVLHYFLSGYTAKIAGTEYGIDEPQATFSACFGRAFLPRHPSVYAKLLLEKIRLARPKVWLINTGWTGGGYGIGKRIPLKFTRSMISAALDGQLDQVLFQREPFFGLMIPQNCPGVPRELLDPAQTWKDGRAYIEQAQELKRLFRANQGTS